MQTKYLVVSSIRESEEDVVRREARRLSANEYRSIEEIELYAEDYTENDLLDVFEVEVTVTARKRKTLQIVTGVEVTDIPLRS